MTQTQTPKLTGAQKTILNAAIDKWEARACDGAPELWGLRVRRDVIDRLVKAGYVTPGMHEVTRAGFIAAERWRSFRLPHVGVGSHLAYVKHPGCVVVVHEVHDRGAWFTVKPVSSCGWPHTPTSAPRRIGAAVADQWDRAFAWQMRPCDPPAFG